MRQIKNRAIRIIFLLFFVTPIVAWFLVKPVRVIAPEIMDIKCFDGGVCLDNVGNYEVAKKLRLEAIEYLNEKVGSFKVAPKVIFCSTSECSGKFGLGKRSAVTFATYGSVIGPRAWKPYYVRHELIHQLQGQELGVLKCLFLPAWLVEGMAYSLSQDPRVTLNEPWEGYRTQFAKWLASIANSSMWIEAAKV